MVRSKQVDEKGPPGEAGPLRAEPIPTRRFNRPLLLLLWSLNHHQHLHQRSHTHTDGKNGHTELLNSRSRFVHHQMAAGGPRWRLGGLVLPLLVPCLVFVALSASSPLSAWLDASDMKAFMTSGASDHPLPSPIRSIPRSPPDSAFSCQSHPSQRRRTLQW